MSAKPSRAEVVDLLALAQDLALGQPLGSQLRAVTLAEARAGAGPAEQATVWCASSLRFLGCTGHAFDMAVVFGDEIAMRADTAGSTSPTRFEVLGAMLSSCRRGQVRVPPAPLGAVDLGRRQEGGRAQLPHRL